MSTATLTRSPGLLLDPAADPWGDAGLLGFPAEDNDTTPPAPESLRDFIAAAYPRYGFHRWADLLTERLQEVADGELSRLIVTCPPRLGKSLLVSKLFPAYFIQRHPQLFCAIASYSAELAYARTRAPKPAARVAVDCLMCMECLGSTHQPPSSGPEACARTSSSTTP